MIPAAPLYNGMPPQGVASIQSTVPAVCSIVPPGLNGATLNRTPKDSEAYVDMGLAVGDMGANLATGALGKVAGPVGAAVSSGFNLASTSIHNQREVERLLDIYRDTVAMQLGIPPETVTEVELRVAAEHFSENKMLREEFNKIDERSVKNPVRSLVTGLAAVGGGALGMIGGVPGTLAGSFAASSVADNVMDGIIGKEGATPFTALQQAETKLQSGQGVSATDMFLFHVAASSDLATQIEGHMGDRFEDLPDSKKTRTMLRDHPALTELCKYEAFLINSKMLPPASLMDGNVQTAIKQQFEQYRTQTAQMPRPTISTQGAEVARYQPPMQTAAITQQPRGNYAQAVTQERAAITPQTPSVQ